MSETDNNPSTPEEPQAPGEPPAAQPQSEPQTSAPGDSELSTDARQWGMFAHLAALAGFVVPFGNVIGPLIVWQLKKDEFSFVDDQGKEALNFQITVIIAFVIAFVLSFVLIGFLLMPIIGIGALVLVIIGALKANAGETYRYPINWRLLT